MVMCRCFCFCCSIHGRKKEKIGNRKQNLKKVFLKHVTYCTIVKYNSDDPVLLG